MKITPVRVLFFVVTLILLVIVGFFYMLMYEKKTDVSKDARFSERLNVPIQVNVVSTIRWNKNNLRFKNHSLHENEDSHYDREDVKSVKIYQPDDTLYFYAAKSYKSMHVGETYYLLGRDTLSSGAIIEFEYYTASNYSQEIWETEDAFLNRVRE